MKSRRIGWMVVVMIMTAFLLCLGTWSKANAQGVQMRLAHYVDDKHPLHLGASSSFPKWMSGPRDR